VVESDGPATARGARSETPKTVDELFLPDLSVDEARRRILDAFTPLSIEIQPLAGASGAVLAEPLLTSIDLPRFTNAAMDGYAVRSVDAGRAAPLPVAFSVGAGDGQATTLAPGSAARIMTGAPLPAGADTVIPFEHATFAAPDLVRFDAGFKPGANVRVQGSDRRAGDLLLPAGTRIGPPQLALLASVGVAAISIHRRPRVAVLATGDEIIAPGQALNPGQIWDANSAAIIAMIADLGAVPVSLGIARDDPSELIGRFDEMTNLGADLLITSGGVSAGDFDMVKQVLRDRGSVEIWRVRMKPGQPLAFGKIGGVPVLGLPGNPVAALVSFLQFARPAILTMLGAPAAHRELVEVPVAVLDTIDNPGGRRFFVRVTVSATADGFAARRVGGQGSADVASFAGANGLLVIPETVARVEPGTRLWAQMPGWTID
jgi:molybdopterin molybdotransferase